MVGVKAEVFIFLLSSVYLVKSKIGLSNACYRHVRDDGLTLAVEDRVRDIDPPPSITLQIGGYEINFKYMLGMTCVHTFRIRYPSSHDGRYNVNMRLKLHPSLKPTDEYELSFGDQQSDSIQRIGGYDPNTNIYVQIVGSQSQLFVQSLGSHLGTREPLYNPKTYYISEESQLCVVIFYKSKRLVMPIRSKGATQYMFDIFRFTAMVSEETSANGRSRGIVTFESSGYLVNCRPDFMVDSPPLTYFIFDQECTSCSVKLLFSNPYNLNKIDVSYYQRPGTRGNQVTADPSNALVFPTLKLLPFSDVLAPEIPNGPYLPLLHVEPKPTSKTCVYEHRIELTESVKLYKKTHVVSRVYRAFGVNTGGPGIVASRVVEPWYIVWCECGNRWISPLPRNLVQ